AALPISLPKAQLSTGSPAASVIGLTIVVSPTPEPLRVISVALEQLSAAASATSGPCGSGCRVMVCTCRSSKPKAATGGTAVSGQTPGTATNPRHSSKNNNKSERRRIIIASGSKPLPGDWTKQAG